MPILLDTNVYLFAMRSDEGAAFFERRFLPLVFQTHLSSVVVEELYAGALDAQAERLVESYVGALERAGREVGVRSCILYVIHHLLPSRLLNCANPQFSACLTRYPFAC